MTARTTHLKVDNGDMTLVKLESGRTILVDINIRSDSTDDESDTPDVLSQLKDRLSKDEKGRRYVDAFLLTHPDQDHCRGLEKHFHLGAPDDWVEDDDKIIVREMWSSPMVFRRASKKNPLCEDAKAWNKEARRRIALFRDGNHLDVGNKIKILGKDSDGKTDDLSQILVLQKGTFSTICGVTDNGFSARLIAPFPPSDEDDEEVSSKNNSSVILNMSLRAGLTADAVRYFFGGDAKVAIWEKVWTEYKSSTNDIAYDVLIAPHHCSWHSLSYDSWSEKGEDAEVSDDARSALSQSYAGAWIISSSKEIKDDKNDPPCIRAKREYVDILNPVSGSFLCLNDDDGDEPVEFDVRSSGPSKVAKAKSGLAKPALIGVGGAAADSSVAYGQQPFRHG